MKSCTRATNATWDRIITATATTLLVRFIDPQPQSIPFSNTLWQVCKVLIKNDKQALPDVVKAVRCWLGL